MSDEKDKLILALDVINKIRSDVLKEEKELKASGDDFDAWDEGQGGVNWIINEISGFDSLATIMDPKWLAMPFPFPKKINTVNKAMNYMAKKNSKLYMLLLYKFVYKNTGRAVFELRERGNADEIMKFLLT